jgi:hypothetical protein
VSPFVPILGRLGKLVPRLGSPHANEVAATAVAIGRTLASAGLAWHDLTARIVEPSVYDGVTQAKRKPPPWPTLSGLDGAGRLAWLDVIDDAPLDIDQHMRLTIDAVRIAIEAGREPTPYGAAVFNRLVKACWQSGLGVGLSEEMVA